MKKPLLFLLLITIGCLFSFSQIRFENGYIVNQNNEKIDCLIKNIDWTDNPDKFEYMLPGNQEVKIARPGNVKEFGIINEFKYISSFVKIDTSSDYVGEVSSNKQPEFKEEQLFLKVLIEGKASLYMYKGGKLIRFFYRKDSSGLNQLIYKRYRAIDNAYYAGNSMISKPQSIEYYMKNNFYKQQLLMELQCQDISYSEVERIDYNEKYLEKLFLKYNECMNSGSITYKNEIKKDLFNLTLRPGVNFCSLSMGNKETFPEIDFGSGIIFRIGAEFEFILPYNKNKWSVMVEPTYQNYQAEKKQETNKVSGGYVITNTKYNLIELPLGLRYYFFLNDKSKIFLNVSYVFNFKTSSIIDLKRSDSSLIYSLDINSTNNFAGGAGYKYKRFSLEVRYNSTRDIIKDYINWSSDFKSFSFILGYSLF